MGSTNTTTNYSLSQFISTDKPAWLQDYNGDMLKIDTAIKAAKTAADSAQSTADTASSASSTNTSAITSLQTTVQGLNTSVTNIQSAVNTIQSLIGNGTPTTTDHTIIGAINEMNAYLHLKKMGRVDLSLASTRKAVWDTLYTFLASQFSSRVNGKIIFSTGSAYDFNGSGSDGLFEGYIDWLGTGGVLNHDIVYCQNGASIIKDVKLEPSANTYTDVSNRTNASTWADIYVWE